MDKFPFLPIIIIMKVIHPNSGLTLGSKVKEATSFFQRLRGYMLYANPPTTFDGIYFPNSIMVHNSFVHFSLDVIFINRSNVIVKVIRGFQPWRFSRIYLKAAHVIEFPAGTIPEAIMPGDQLILEN